MTYPAQPGYPPQAPQQPHYPAPQGYAPPAQQYPPQQPGYPAPQGYAPQQPQYAPQQPQYAPPQQAQPQGPPPVAGSLDAFWSQPATGWGPAWKINAQTPVGSQFAGVVARPLTDSDVEHQSKYQQPGVPDYFRDGRPKMVMKVPLFVQPGPEYPDGRAQFYVSGSATTELVRAMAEVGAQGEPEEGATIHVTVVSKRQNRSGTMSNVLAITYQRPQGAGAAPAAQPTAPQAPAQPPTPEQPATLPPQGPPIATYAPPAPPQAAPQAPPAPPAPLAAPAPQQAYQPPAPPQAAAPATPPAPGALPPEVANDPQKMALLASLGVQTPVAG